MQKWAQSGNLTQWLNDIEVDGKILEKRVILAEIIMKNVAPDVH